MRRVAVAMAVMAACSSTSVADRVADRVVAPVTTTTVVAVPSTTTNTTSTTVPAIVEVPYRIEVRTDEPGFAATVDAVLSDPRGWQRARFRLVRRDDAPYAVVLAEPDEAQRLCLPYDVYSKYSCQNGSVVVLNAERWRSATPEWTGDLPTYRIMLINHEFGHLLGQKHPRVQCPEPGRPAAVMAQQSTELNGCLPNPWPLDWEIARAARHDLPLAPPFEPSS